MINNHSLGIILQILHSAIFSAVILLFLSLDYSLPVMQIFFLTSLSGLIIMLPWLLIVNKQRLLTKYYKLYIYRALFNVLAIYSWTESMKFFPFNEMCSIDYLTPIFTLVLATLFSLEKMNFRYFIMLLINSVAVYFILFPKHNIIFHDKLGIAIFAALMWAGYNIICKLQANLNEDIFTQAFYTFLFSVVFTTPMLFFSKPIKLYHIGTIFLIAALCILSTFMLFAAYRTTPLSTLMPFCYTKIIFILCGSYFFFDEKPRDLAIIGVAIIFSTLCYVIYNDYKTLTKIKNAPLQTL